MDDAIAFLVRIAAIVIIIAGGYFAWNIYYDATEANTATANRDVARAEIFRLAEAGVNQTEKVRIWCKTASTTVFTGEAQTVADRMVKNCRALGYLD